MQKHENEQIRIGAIWSIINLTWPDDAGVKHRIDMLRNLNFESALNVCSINDLSADVRDRAKTALANLKETSISFDQLSRDVEMRNIDDC